MKSSQTLYYWFAVFALCFIAYQQVQDTIRPGYTGGDPVVQYALGVAPNFFPAIGIPALFFVLIPMAFRNSEKRTWTSSQRHITANLASLVGLLGWEFLQPMTRRGHFDWHDVLWTLIGAVVFHLMWTITPDRYKANSG